MGRLRRPLEPTCVASRVITLQGVPPLQLRPTLVPSHVIGIAISQRRPCYSFSKSVTTETSFLPQMLPYYTGLSGRQPKLRRDQLQSARNHLQTAPLTPSPEPTPKNIPRATKPLYTQSVSPLEEQSVPTLRGPTSEPLLVAACLSFFRPHRSSDCTSSTARSRYGGSFRPRFPSSDTPYRGSTFLHS